MKHYSTEVLLDYAEGEAEYSLAHEIGLHLQDCETCRSVIGASLRLKSAVGNLADPSEQFVTAVVTRTAAKHASRTLRAANIAVKSRRSESLDLAGLLRLWLFPAAQFACALMLFAITSAGTQGNPEDSGFNATGAASSAAGTLDESGTPDGSGSAVDVGDVLLAGLHPAAAEDLSPGIENWPQALGLNMDQTAPEDS